MPDLILPPRLNSSAPIDNTIQIVLHTILIDDIYLAIITEDFSLRIRFMSDNAYKTQADHKRICETMPDTPIQIQQLERFYRKDWKEFFGSIR